MLRKLAIVGVVCAVAFTQAACDWQTVKDGFARAFAAYNLLRTSLSEARETIRVGCSSLNLAEQEAPKLGEKCSRTVTSIKAGQVAICQNVDLLDDKVVGNYVKSIGTAVKDAQAACK